MFKTLQYNNGNEYYYRNNNNKNKNYDNINQ